MTHTPHELHEEFPAKADTIQALRESDTHFRRLTDEYHEVNRAIHRAESRTEPTSEEQEEELPGPPQGPDRPRPGLTGHPV